MSGIASTLATIVKSKVALAALGTVLVGGTGTAAVVAASTGHLGPIQTPSFHQSSDESDGEKGDHPHTVSIEGDLASLKTCPATVTQIVVTKANEGDEHDAKETDDKASGTPTVKRTPSATHAPEAPEATHAATHAPEANEAPEPTKSAGTSTFTIKVDSKTKVNGEDEKAKTLADLCSGVGHKVEVEANKAADGTLTAWKVTLRGADGQANEKDDGNKGTPTSGVGQGEHESVDGTVATIGSTSFMLSVEGKTVTVVVTSSTAFPSGSHGLSSLHAGEHVAVQGTRQSDGSILATHIQAQGSH